MEISISAESPLTPEARELIAELNAHLLTLTPPEFCFHLSVEEMADERTTFFVARDAGLPVGCGALYRHAPELAEVKRMYVRPPYRKKSIARQILDRIVAQARADGITRLALETGHRHEAAWALYEGAGFTRCGAFADYPDSTYSVFYEKTLSHP